MDKDCQNLRKNASSRKKFSRREALGRVITFEEAKKKLGFNQRSFAKIFGIPHSTFQQWIQNKASINAPPEVIAFLESPAGYVFLHQIVMAALFVITQMAPGSIRMCSTFLKLSGLEEFVASSYGSVQKVVTEMEEQILLFGRIEFERLGREMKFKRVTIFEDETFHPQICLVAIEAASGFIFLEAYAEARDSETWKKMLKKALGNLPIEIVQVTSDEAKALVKHAEKEIGANHSPDLFHVIHELFKGTSLAMAREVKAARSAVEDAKATKTQLEQSKQFYIDSGSSSPHCSLEKMQKNIDDAQAGITLAEESLAESEKDQQDMGDAIRGISECHHPFDLETGEVRSAQTVAAAIGKKFETIDEIAQKVRLSDSGLEHIDKARRVVPLMIATIAFFHQKVRTWIEEFCLSEPLQDFILKRWIPARYVELVAGRASDAAMRNRLRSWAAKLMPSPQEIGRMLSSLCDNDRILIAYAVEECAQLFQRSSSAVEGRNGHLSLFHHGHHRLPQRKLEARTVIHNFMKMRPDETTAAERFFDQEPMNLFAWLLEHMGELKRPAKRSVKLAS
jgi:transposase-like protein